MDYYPIFLNLQNRLCVVIGGGKVAEGKVDGLLAAAARVRVVSPALTPALEQLARDQRIEHLQRAYLPGDLAEAFLAISATDERAVNEQVWQEANARNLLVNVVDDTPTATSSPPPSCARATWPSPSPPAARPRPWPCGCASRSPRWWAPARPFPGAGRQPARETRRTSAPASPSAGRCGISWSTRTSSTCCGAGDESAARARMEEIMGVPPDWKYLAKTNAAGTLCPPHSFFANFN